MVPTAVFLFMAASLGYGSTLDDNYPSTTDNRLIDTVPKILSQDPTLKEFPLPITLEMHGYVLRTLAENDFTSKMAFDYANQGSTFRVIIDLILHSWSMYHKELALNNTYENEKSTVEVNYELEGSTGVTEQSSIDDGDSTRSTAPPEMESFYNEKTQFRSRRLLKNFVQTKYETVRPSTLLEDSTTATTSKKKYFFVTNLKIDRGTAGIHYPDYANIPVTSFSCSDITIIPGFYADLETGCQVFHACWPDRRESLLCPVGTTFNQTLMKCDYWYNTDCSMASHFFDLNIHFLKEKSMNTDSLSTTSQNEYSATSEATKPYEASNSLTAETEQLEKELSTDDWNQITDFLPVKAKITVYSKSSEYEREPTPDVSLPQRSALKSKQAVAEQEKVRKVQVASRIVDGALGLAERFAKETAKMVMEIIEHRAESEEKARKVEAAAKIVDEATDLAAKVAKDTAQLVNRITLEAIRHQVEKSVNRVIPAEMEPKVNTPDVKHLYSTTPKITHQKSLEVNPRFVVKQHAAPETVKQIEQLGVYNRNDVKDHVLEIIDKAFEMVLNVNVYPATRQAILENYVKFSLSKKH